MDLYSTNGNDDNNDFFVKQKDNYGSFEALGFIGNYGQFLKRCTKSETVINGANLLKTYTEKGKSPYVKSVAQNTLKGLWKEYKSKEEDLSTKKDDASVKQLTEVTATKDKLKEIYDSSK